MNIVPIEQFEKPRQRKGFVLTAVWWNPETGRIRFTKYEPIVRPRPEPPADRQSPMPTRRGVVAASQGQLL